MNQKGFSAILLLLLSLLILGAILVAQTLSKQNSQYINTPYPLTPQTNTTYSDKDLGYSFSYPGKFKVVEDTEAAYSQRGRADFRKNFISTWYYDPPKLIKGLSMQNPQDSTPFDSAPFSLWVFDNPKNMEASEWYKNYWYYPFVWGEYEPRKSQGGPDLVATVSGQPASYKVITYRSEKPKFVYLNSQGRMYLFRIVDQSQQNTGSKTLDSFKLK